MRRLIRTNGTTQDFASPVPGRLVAGLIGAGEKGIDFVTLKHMGHPLHVMHVDGSGHQTKETTSVGPLGETRITIESIGHNKPVNEEATRLYWLNCRPGTTHQIVGDVFICPDDDFAP